MEDKNIVKINHPYRHATVNETEAWLKKQAENGLRLVGKKDSLFTFRKCKPYETEYFMYSSFNANAGIFHDYHVAKELYGKNGSEINKLFVLDIIMKKMVSSIWAILRIFLFRKSQSRLTQFFARLLTRNILSKIH